MRPFRVLLAAALLLAAGLPALADVDVEVSLGHNGLWVERAATPCAIELKNTGEEAVDVTLRLGHAELIEGGGASHHRTVYLPSGGARREVFLISGPSTGRDLRLDVETNPTTAINHGGKRASKGNMAIDVRNETNVGRQSRPLETRIVGTVFDEGNALQYTLERGIEGYGDTFTGAQEELGVLRVDPRDLRLAPFSLDGIDTLVVCNPMADFLAQPAELDGVLDWVALGGHLVVSLGKDSAAFASSPLARHMPATWISADGAEYADVLAVADLAHEDGITRRGPFTKLTLAKLPGVRFARGNSGDLSWVWRPFGQGTITLCPIDLPALAPILQDKKQRRAFGKLLAPLRVPEIDTAITTAGMGNFGTSINLQSAFAVLMRRDAFEPPPFALVALGLLVYVLVVGPLDWLILKRLKKERLTTITFAVAVTGFTLLAYGASFLLFSTGEVVNRLVLADLVDGGRDGRELLRVIDVASYYAPTGTTRDLDYDMPSLVAPGSLPGLADAPGLGRDRPVQVHTRDPLRARAVLEVGFRSQRAIRGIAVDATGRSLDVSWEKETGKGDPRLVNGLPTDLDGVWLLTPDGLYTFGALASGAEAVGKAADRRAEPGRGWIDGRTELSEDSSDGEVLDLLAYLSLARRRSDLHRKNPFRRLSAREMAVFQKTGVDLSGALMRGNGLLIAYAEEPPVTLPGDGDDGNVYVVLRKEIPLR